eukprot:TRINITY_DN60069_c0_g1_i1.p1 TRINITY_DN60069_c0_g1~~TRINITY_DN60069_c0_g1_i1.p1  ORF type:complete len:771 (+),score=197.02 TRINITY_DN60069_c0_g1_i1:86-2314(+)
MPQSPGSREAAQLLLRPVPTGMLSPTGSWWRSVPSPPGSPGASASPRRWWHRRWPAPAPQRYAEVDEAESIGTDELGSHPGFRRRRPPCSANESRAHLGGPPVQPILRRDDLTQQLIEERKRREVEVLIDLLSAFEEAKKRPAEPAPAAPLTPKVASPRPRKPVTFRAGSGSDHGRGSPQHRGSVSPQHRPSCAHRHSTATSTHRSLAEVASAFGSGKLSRRATELPAPPMGTRRWGALTSALQLGRDVPMPDTKLTWPLVPWDAQKLRTDARWALCRFFQSEGWCRRGVRCTFLHSTHPARENFRRMMMKVRARVQWAHGIPLAAVMDFSMRNKFPPPEPFEWSDNQLAQLPVWCIEMPRTHDTCGGIHPAADIEQFVSNLAAEIKKWPQVVSFELRKCPLPPPALRHVTNALRVCTELRKLRLVFCDLDCHSAEALADFVEGHESLEELELDFNNIGAKGVDHICRAAEACWHLRKLSLHGNPAGDEGGSCIGRFLQTSGGSRLANLELSFTMMGDLGLTALSRGLRNARSLTTLSIDGIHPSMVGCLALFEVLKRNTTLMQLSLRFNRATTERFVDNCEELLRRNHAIREKTELAQQRERAREVRLASFRARQRNCAGRKLSAVSERDSARVRMQVNIAGMGANASAEGVEVTALPPRAPEEPLATLVPFPSNSARRAAQLARRAASTAVAAPTLVFPGAADRRGSSGSVTSTTSGTLRPMAPQRPATYGRSLRRHIRS